MSTLLYRIMGSSVVQQRTCRAAFVASRTIRFHQAHPSVRHHQTVKEQSFQLVGGDSIACRFLATTSEPTNAPEPMENLYQEWTLEQDRLLWEHRNEPLSTLACLLGRGVRGVQYRLKKLNDVESAVYERLFGNKKDGGKEQEEKQEKLVPAMEVLRRIQYDPLLFEQDFVILHYDRVQDKVLESPMDTPNSSVDSTETHFVLALPEHRIMAVRYRERVVWDRNRRIDRVFGGSNGQTILDIRDTYDEWKQERDRIQEWNRQRQAHVSSQIQLALGQDRFMALKQASSDLRQDASESSTTEVVLPKVQLESYVKMVLQLFRGARQDPMSCPEPSLVPTTDLLALDMFSELVALLPDRVLRPAIMNEVVSEMNRLEGKSSGRTKRPGQLPELMETDLEESFVRGSGAGGQKINKTANRVVLVHKPTQLRVECQDTRSLQQNRKIARKRLRYKLDEFLNGSESRASLETTRARNRKSKSKARNRARQKRKKLHQEQQQEEEDA